MTKPAYIDTAIRQTYDLEGLLRVLSLAVDGEETSGRSFTQVGGGRILDMAADLAANILDGLERGRPDVRPRVGAEGDGSDRAPPLSGPDHKKGGEH